MATRHNVCYPRLFPLKGAAALSQRHHIVAAPPHNSSAATVDELGPSESAMAAATIPINNRIYANWQGCCVGISKMYIVRSQSTVLFLFRNENFCRLTVNEEKPQRLWRPFIHTSARFHERT